MSLSSLEKKVLAFLTTHTGRYRPMSRTSWLSRGFETVTYVLEGEMNHEDFVGNKGTLLPGGLQWMTAGRGVVHSEMPGWERTRGLQLWVNLARAEKMVEPAYQELTAEQVPDVASEDGRVNVKVIAGTAMGVTSPVRTRTPTYYLDVRMKPGSKYSQEVPEGWTTFVYILEGTFQLGSRRVAAHHTVLFQREGEGVELESVGEEEGRLVVVAGRPVGEPVVQHGPFVMCSNEEIDQTLRDYRRAENGFENVTTWKSGGQ